MKKLIVEVSDNWKPGKHEGCPNANTCVVTGTHANGFPCPLANARPAQEMVNFQALVQKVQAVAVGTAKDGKIFFVEEE